MLYVDVLNRTQAEDYNPKDARLVDVLEPVMVSVTQPDTPANLKEGWYDVLRLEFHDVIQQWESNEFPAVPMDQDDARKLIDFMFEHGRRNVFVHCDAGISRSVAIGMFLAKWQDRKMNLHAVNTTDFYNSHVHSLLWRTLWDEAYKEG